MMSTLVLIPGLACDAELWRGQFDALAANHPVQVSDVHFRHTTLPAMAAALLAGSTGPLVLVGHSMGAMVALEAMRLSPRRVRAMALLSGSARADTPGLRALRSQACELFAAGRIDEVLHANVPFAFHPLRAGDATLVDRYLAMVRRAGAAQLISQNRAVMERPDSRPLLPSIDRPLLAACGDADALTPPELTREIAALAPRAQAHIVAGAGHMLPMEQPERVTALLLEWLRSAVGLPLTA